MIHGLRAGWHQSDRYFIWCVHSMHRNVPPGFKAQSIGMWCTWVLSLFILPLESSWKSGLLESAFDFPVSLSRSASFPVI